MHHIINDISGVIMGRGFGGFKASALVNRNIDQAPRLAS